MSKNDKWVRRFEVDETAKHENRFTIYKITSVLFPISSPEVLSVVSVWKRFSEVQRLHAGMCKLHAGLQLPGSCPDLPSHSYFRRFHPEVVAARAQATKALLEFVAEHQLLFTSTDFVNFLQTGYPQPAITTKTASNIAAIRSSLHLPVEETPPMEYATSDDDSRSPEHSANPNTVSVDETDYSQIPIYEAADVEMPSKPNADHRSRNDQIASKSESFESLDSLESIDSDLYSELEKVTLSNTKSCVKKSVLPDLINFDAPSTSKFEDYPTMLPDFQSKTQNTLKESHSDSISLNSNSSTLGSSSRTSHSLLSLSNVESKTRTEDSYVFEAGYVLNLATRYEDLQDYEKAFECYKAGIEKMLIGVQVDPDPQRRALIKEKTNKYLSYAENIYKNHLCNVTTGLLSERDDPPQQAPPVSMLRRPYDDLALYRVLAVLGSSMMLVLHKGDHTCYAMKVIQKVPNNLTEFDEYFLQNTNETRKPILPTLVPYMVPLISYIETNNLIFLILSYAPGQRLLDYIKDYVKSLPNSPAREVNLENVFAEPKAKKFGARNDSIIPIENETKNVHSGTDNANVTRNLDVDFRNNENLGLNNQEKLARDEIDAELNNTNNNTQNTGNNTQNTDKNPKETVISESELSVTEMVRNSKTLLQNVDRVLNEMNRISPRESEREQESERQRENTDRGREDDVIVQKDIQMDKGMGNPASNVSWPRYVMCNSVLSRDLNPSNILLGDRGQVCLTYITSYSDHNEHLGKLRLHKPNLYVAPELYDVNYCLRFNGENGLEMERVCDFWSFGAIMYELICGVPLKEYHQSVFTAHTILWLPDNLPVEAHSLLTQLLTADPRERLGAGGVGDIKWHPYFKHVDWQALYDGWTMQPHSM